MDRFKFNSEGIYAGKAFFSFSLRIHFVIFKVLA